LNIEQYIVRDGEDWLEIIADFSDINDSHYSDEELLEAREMLLRGAESDAICLELVEAEIEKREMLEPTPTIELSERDDDWLAERRYDIKSELVVANSKVEELKNEREDIDEELKRRFSERKTSGTRTNRFTLSMGEDDNYPIVIDRNEFEDYILKTGNIHLLQKRLSLTATREELDALNAEKQGILDKLEEAKWSDDICVDVMLALSKEDASTVDEIVEIHNRKILVLRATGKLQEATKNALDEHYTIPGVGIEPKLTISQVKRNK